MVLQDLLRCTYRQLLYSQKKEKRLFVYRNLFSGARILYSWVGHVDMRCGNVGGVSLSPTPL